MRIREASAQDVDKIIEFCLPYFKASMHNDRTFNDVMTREMVEFYIQDGSYYTIIAVNEGQLLAVSVMTRYYTFFNDPDGEIVFLYSPVAGVARDMVKVLMEKASIWGVRMLHCCSRANYADGGRNDKLHSNLFKKFGFELAGSNLYYDMKR